MGGSVPPGNWFDRKMGKLYGVSIPFENATEILRWDLKHTIAVIFDFDDTLAPDSTTGLLKKLGVDVDLFWQRVQTMVEDDWDPVPAYLYGIIEESRSGRIEPVTRDLLHSWGGEVRPFRGVATIFRRLKKHAASISHDLDIEFYLISSGIGDVVRNTSISKNFSDIWSCEYHYDDEGHITFPRKIISFTDKTRYIFQISKGFAGPDFRGRPFMVNRKVSPSQMRIPFNRMIFVGDGYTDVPCFSLVRKNGGFTIGVYDRNKQSRWGRAWEFIEDGRVSNLVSADYSQRSDLSNSLFMAVESIARRTGQALSLIHI